MPFKNMLSENIIGALYNVNVLHFSIHTEESMRSIKYQANNSNIYKMNASEEIEWMNERESEKKREKNDRKVIEVVSNSNQHKYDRNQWNNNVVECASVLRACVSLCMCE